MALNATNLQGSSMGLRAPDNFANLGSNWGMPTLPEYSAGAGINPNGINLYGSTKGLDGYSGYQPSDILGGGLTQQSWGDKLTSPDFWFGGTDQKTNMKGNGAAGALLGAAGGLMNGFVAMKQYGLSKDILANNKAQFAANFAAQKGITNSGLSDRQDRRNREASANGNPSSAMSSAEYMSKYGVA